MTRHRRPTPPAPPLTDPAARAEAVAAAWAVLEVRWPAWAGEHRLDPVPALQCSAPRVSVVGVRPDEFHLVAAVRFTFDAAGRTFHGVARGPLEAPTFVVREELVTGADL